MLLLTHSTLSIPGRRIGVHVRATFLAPPPAANPTEDHFFFAVNGHYPTRMLAVVRPLACAATSW